jgi:hypothetical protein
VDADSEFCNVYDEDDECAGVVVVADVDDVILF